MIISLLFAVSAIMLFNSIMCGRILKRFSPELNDYLSVTYGFFLFIGVSQIFFIPAIAIHNMMPRTFLYYLVGIQVFFLTLYLLNWRFSFMRVYIDWKSILAIFLGILIIVAIFFGFKQYGGYEKNPYVTNLMEYYSQGWGENIFNIENMTYIYLIEAVNRSFGLLFKVSNMHLVYEYAWIIVFSVIVTTGLYGMYFYQKPFMLWSLLTYITIVMIIGVCSLVIVSTPSNGGAWILFGTMLIFQVHLDNVKKVKYEIGIININYITLGLFCLTPSSIYIIIIANICLTMLSFTFKRNNATDYNILTLFATVLSVSMYLFLYNYIIGIIFTIIILALYAIYLFIRKSKMITKAMARIDRMSNSTIKIISFTVAIIILLISVFIMTISNKFDFNAAPWTISYFLNKDLTKLGSWYWIINGIWWALNIIIVLYALLAQFTKKLHKYIENAKLTPIILINTMTVWNPISSNLWLKIANSNSLMVQNSFIVNLVSTGINFIYYLLNKNKLSKSLIILGSTTTLATIGLILFNVLA